MEVATNVKLLGVSFTDRNLVAYFEPSLCIIDVYNGWFSFAERLSFGYEYDSH